jgi:glycosyltransferase involved in cell wall biosynthesis
MSLRVGIVVPHIFMQDDVLPNVIFSPGQLAQSLSDELTNQGVSITLFTPGSVTTSARNITADLSYFQTELNLRGDSYVSLLKKHPLTFITLARQVQAELLMKAFEMANNDELDVVHIYTNEEELGLVFQKLCTKPVVFTHHDPFSFLVQYRSNMPKYKDSNWLAISDTQKTEMPPDTNWIKTIHHGLDENEWPEQTSPKEGYIAYIGRIIEPKGVHLAIQATILYNTTHQDSPLTLKIAGKHYSGTKAGSYWQEQIEPYLSRDDIEYVGFIDNEKQKQQFLAKAQALVMPSIFSEPFGMVAIEALACSTQVIGLNSGAIPEIVSSGENGFVVEKEILESSPKGHILAPSVVDKLAATFEKINTIDPDACRKSFMERFTLQMMAAKHIEAYETVLENN